MQACIPVIVAFYKIAIEYYFYIPVVVAYIIIKVVYYTTFLIKVVIYNSVIVLFL